MFDDVHDPGILTARVERRDGEAHLVVAGELDLAAGDVLTAAAGTVHPSYDRVVVDLRGVTFIDIAGLDRVVDLRDLLLAAGCRVEIDTTGIADVLLRVPEMAHVLLGDR